MLHCYSALWSGWESGGCFLKSPSSRTCSHAWMRKPSPSCTCKAFVRPHLEYGNVIWHPRFEMDKIAVEKVQRRATKLAPKLKHLPMKKDWKNSSYHRWNTEDEEVTWSMSTKSCQKSTEWIQKLCLRGQTTLWHEGTAKSYSEKEADSNSEPTHLVNV